MVTKTKEEHNMNAVHYEPVRRVTANHYPNAAGRRERIERFADGILAAAICIGVGTILFFLITMD